MSSNASQHGNNEGEFLLDYTECQIISVVFCRHSAVDIVVAETGHEQQQNSARPVIGRRDGISANGMCDNGSVSSALRWLDEINGPETILSAKLTGSLSSFVKKTKLKVYKENTTSLRAQKSDLNWYSFNQKRHQCR